jgi:hypothetical protein
MCKENNTNILRGLLMYIMYRSSGILEEKYMKSFENDGHNLYSNIHCVSGIL